MTESPTHETVEEAADAVVDEAVVDTAAADELAFDQVTPLGELTVRWTGSEEGEIEVSDDFDTLDTTLDAELARDGSAEEDA